MREKKKYVYKPSITRTSLFKYTENFTTKKMKVFRWKILKIFIFLLKT